MSYQNNNDALLDMFLFESTQLIESLEQSVLSSDSENDYTKNDVNEIFRIMHTIKGSAAFMNYHQISNLAHGIEDIFFFVREEKPQGIDYTRLTDLILDSLDFIKIELEKVRNNDQADGDAGYLISMIGDFLREIKKEDKFKEDKTTPFEYESIIDNPVDDTFVSTRNLFKAVIYFEDGCEMENVRAYTIVRNLTEVVDQICYEPDDILENEKSNDIIRKQGFVVHMVSSKSYDEIYDLLSKTIFLKELCLSQIDQEIIRDSNDKEELETTNLTPRDMVDSFNKTYSKPQSIISVNVGKLDKLMDLVGEIVIAETMVVQNPELKGLVLNDFYKAANQLNKIIGELQETVMSVRMVPLTATFHKMNRIIRDMTRKLSKEVRLDIIGDETEVDKNIIEHISDPLMHLVRNAIDHGMETMEERIAKGKSAHGTLTLEASNTGSDVVITVSDDGRGLNKDKILKRAFENQLITEKHAGMTDGEIYNLILLPGFSTKETITEYSGRGVGMDVVMKNIESIGGSISINSKIDRGTQFILKIPLTLAIIDGMNLKVGTSYFTLPTSAIREAFRPKKQDIITDFDHQEMILVRDQCYPILRLHKIFDVQTELTSLEDGILIILEQDTNVVCLFADQLLGQQQVVVKALPNYINRIGRIQGLTGCTLLGDGRISLILDVSGMIHMSKNVRNERR